MHVSVISLRRHGAALGAAFLALSACSNEPGTAETKVERAFPANAVVPPSQPPSANASDTAGAAANALAEAPGVKADGLPQSARRCGWLHNPTPGNWWLVDRNGEWLLGTQGGYQAPGLDEMPDMSEVDWQETNGHYGYGCACLTLTVDPVGRKVTRIADATPKPLAQCRADTALPKP